MIVGDAFRFAIEFEFDDHQAELAMRRFGFGHVRFLLNGSTVGNVEEYSSLGTIATSLLSSVEHRAVRRSVESFCEASAEAIFSELDWVVFGVGRDHCSLQLEDPRERMFRHFFVNPTVDALGDQKIIVVECAEVQRVIWENPGGGVLEVTIAAGEFESVVCQFIAAVDWRMSGKS